MNPYIGPSQGVPLRVRVEPKPECNGNKAVFYMQRDMVGQSYKEDEKLISEEGKRKEKNNKAKSR